MRCIVGALPILLALGMVACGGKAPVGPGTALGEGGQDQAVNAALKDPVLMAAGLGVARHVLYDEDAPDTADLAALPGRRAFVCAYQEKPTMICESGVGDDLAASIKAAATALKAEAGRRIDPAELSGGGFSAARAFFVPPGGPGQPAFITTVTGPEGLELCLAMPRALASGGRLNKLLDDLRRSLAP